MAWVPPFAQHVKGLTKHVQSNLLWEWPTENVFITQIDFMVVILDTAKGQAHNFTTRTAAAEFIGVSRPTLRGWLKSPFYLYKTLIITHTSNEKIKESREALFKIKADIFGGFNANESRPINGSTEKEASVLVRDQQPD